MLPTGNYSGNSNGTGNSNGNGDGNNNNPRRAYIGIGYGGLGGFSENLPTRVPHNIARNMFHSIQEENEALMDMLGVPRIDIPLVGTPTTPPLTAIAATTPPSAPARRRRDPSTLPAALFQPPIDPNPFVLPPAMRPGLTLRDLLPPAVVPELMQNTLLPAVLAHRLGVGAGLGLGMGLGFGLGVGGEHDELMRALNHSLQTSEGSYASVISEKGKEQLKEESYHKPDDLDEPEECPIMHVPFEEGETVIRLPCEHLFGADAIRHWLEKEKAECPVCRFRMDSVEVKKRREAVPAPPTEGTPLAPMPPDVPPTAEDSQPTEQTEPTEQNLNEEETETATTPAHAPAPVPTHYDIEEIDADNHYDDDDDDDDHSPSLDTIFNEVREALFGNPSSIQMLAQRRLVPPTSSTSTNPANYDDLRSLREAGVFDDMSSDPAIQALLFEAFNRENQQ